MGTHNQIALIDVSPDKGFSNTIAKQLGITPHATTVAKLKDGDTTIKIEQDIGGKDAYIFQSYLPPLGERLYELQNAASAAQGARRITAVMPYCFGMRGERPAGPQQPVQAEVVAATLHASGITNVISIGLHSKTVEDIFRKAGITLLNLTFEHIAADYILKNSRGKNDVIIASPDAGGAARVLETTKIVNNTLKANAAIGEKHRRHQDSVETLEIKDDVKGKTVFIYDDIGDTLGTIYAAVQAVKEKEAREIYIIIIHPVLGQGFEEKLEKLCNDPLIKEIAFGNTIPLKGISATYQKVRIIPLEPIFAEAISQLHFKP